MSEVTFDLELDDGRIAHCWRACVQEYQNCAISAGLVEGIEPDTLYLRFERDGEEPMTIFARPDEFLAVMYVCSGALWSQEMLDKDSDDDA